MKKTIFLFLLAGSFLPLSAQPLFTYGKNNVGKEEFLRAYNKNKSKAADQEAALREYLDLYINFKLKVQAARDQKLDTLPQIKYDLENFRSQVQENYLTDEAATKRLMDEAIARSKKDLHIRHFSVSDEADSNRAILAANRLYESLQKGNTNYDQLIRDVSQTGASAKTSDLGFITVFNVPYIMETIMYGLKPGECSKPYRSKNTWHVFKLMEERPAAGKWKVAQIMLALPPDNDPGQIAELEKKADVIYKEAIAGKDFGKLAADYSEDKLTFQTGGEMAEFGTGKYGADFEEKVFALKKDGDITAPFRTSIGIHIVKRLSQTPIPTDPSDIMYAYEMKQKMQEDARYMIARDKLAEETKSKIGIKRNTLVTDAELKRYADSLLMAPEMDESTLAFAKKKVLTFKDGSAQTGADWLRFIRQTNPSVEFSMKDIMPRYMNWATLEYYKQHLEQTNPEFRFQMQEFREGNLLFEAMERNVWSKAAEDSTGLKNYYEVQKEKYTWAESGDMIIVNATNEVEADWAQTELTRGRDWRALTEENQELQIDSGRYELSQIFSPGSARLQPGKYSPFSKNADSTVSFIYLLRDYPLGMQRSFDEARGLVINDYQTVLEQKWIDGLKKKYPVKVNEVVFKSMLK